MVNLKQLSSANTRGGGQFQLRPAAEYTVDGVTCFASGDASYEWVRHEWLQEKRINVQWAGAKPSGLDADSAANNTALAKAYSAGNTIGTRRFYIPDGDYVYTKPIRITTVANVHTMFEGDGKRETYLTFKGTGAALDFENGVTYVGPITVRDMTIRGNTAGKVSGSKGINLAYTNLANLTRLNIEYFDCGVDATGQPNNVVFDHLGVSNNSIGIELSGNANGCSIRNPEVTGNDSIGIYIHNGGSGITIDGGESGSNTIAALKVEDAGLVLVNGHNFESHGSDSADVILVNSASVTFNGTRFIKGSNASMAIYMESANLVLTGGCVFSSYAKTRTILLGDNSCNVVGWGHPKNGEPLIADQTNRFYAPTPFTRYYDNNVFATNDSTRRGLLYQIMRRHSWAATETSDNLFLMQEVYPGVVTRNYLTDNNDLRVSTGPTDSTSYARLDRMRTIVFRKAIVSAAGLFTKDTVNVDKYNQYYNIQVTPMWDSDSTLSVHARTWNNTNGNIIVTLNHPTLTAGGRNITLFYEIRYQTKAWDY